MYLVKTFSEDELSDINPTSIQTYLFDNIKSKVLLIDRVNRYFE